MEAVTRDDVIAKLRELNPRAAQMDLAMYADLFAEYRAAQANITEHGAIVSHPKSGAPISNPYIAVRNAAAKTLRALRIQAGALWDESGA